jgi:hypothetical protein
MRVRELKQNMGDGEGEDEQVPGDAEVKMLAADGMVWDVVDTHYEEATNTFWFRVEPED